MMDLLTNFNTQMQDMPLWVQIWVTWLAIINTASIIFVFTRPETRMVLLAWVIAAASVLGIFYLQGQEMTRLMGLGHAIAWTPLLVYLWRRRGNIFMTNASGIYLHLLFITNFISLLFDYTDVVRFFLGHGM